MYERETEEAREQANYYKREFEGIRNECDSMLKLWKTMNRKSQPPAERRQRISDRQRIKAKGRRSTAREGPSLVT